MSRDDRAEMVARWNELTREVLPAMAAAQHWPIRLDHCFMRVCLDAVLGSPWTERVAKPAIRTMSTAQLRAAVAVAEGLVADPARLTALNVASLRGRQAVRLERAA